MVTVGVCSKLINKVSKNSRYFVGIFNKTIIPLTLDMR